MKKSKIVEIFVFEDSFFFTTKTKIKRVEEDRIVLQGTRLLNRFAVIGRKVHMKYTTFALPAKVVGKTGEEIIVTLPSLNPERPVGDRRSARVPPSHVHPVKLYIKVNGERREYEIEDISEGGFSILVQSPAEIENFIEREVEVHIDFPVEAEEVSGTAKLVNIQELENGSIKLGFETFLDDADIVKVRFYVYSRIREILRE